MLWSTTENDNSLHASTLGPNLAKVFDHQIHLYKKFDDHQVGAVWDILTFMDTGGQPQFISMLPAVNSFAMITFIVHKLQTGGLNSLNETVKVQYGNEKREVC